MEGLKNKTKKRVANSRIKLQGLLTRVNKDMYAKNLELAETNQTLSLLRNIDNLVLESHEKLGALCQKIAEEILEHTNFGAVGILASPVGTSELFLYGFDNSFDIDISRVKLSLELDLHKGWIVGPDKMVLIDLEKITHAQLEEQFDYHATYIWEIVKKLPIKSAIAIKLIARRRIVGMMIVGFPAHVSELSDKQKVAAERISESIGVAIDNKLLYDENQMVMKRLLNTNRKLRELDETKDEFISMASHQLRTPLTSVKGYMSMVMEGDAGKLNKRQQNLLNQAFVSSQRMVYLIADLLNVSRLKTGKFIIDAQPADLSEMIEGEIAQLRETAKLKKIEMKYDRPKKFPRLMLDETKVRQVIMNFIDNSIYYTPPGGHINVGVQEDDGHVYFTVKDDGLGVPKEDQKHLFTKFYRASNARNARPDGTGLGLFMAKKVVDAQGGNILFESTEGKGSLFGFSFDKRKLALPEGSKTA